MKILFYTLVDLQQIKTVNQYCDYMVDSLFHGFKQLYGDDCIEFIQLPHWYTNFKEVFELYGNGFTIFALTKPPTATYDNIEEKIKNKYFDQIIIPIHNNMHMNPHNISIIKKIIEYGNIVKVIDGNDDIRVQTEIADMCLFFKRELIQNYKNVLPISFSVPEQKIINKIPQKINNISHNMPCVGGRSAWKIKTEADYYYQYQNSWFGYTTKKGGWDCMRHYEILANGCIPLFPQLECCPNNILFKLPKKLLIDVFTHHQQLLQQTKALRDIITQLLYYTKDNLTTKKMASYILEQ